MDVGDLLNAALVLLVGVLLNYVISDRFRQQNKLLEIRFEANDKEHAAIRSDLEGLRAEVASLRSDLTQVALAVGARPRQRRAD